MNEAPANHFKPEPDDKKAPTVDTSISHIKSQFEHNPKGDACAAYSQLRLEIQHSEQRAEGPNATVKFTKAMLQKLQSEGLLPALSIAAKRLEDEEKNFKPDQTKLQQQKKIASEALTKDPAVKMLDGAITASLPTNAKSAELLNALQQEKVKLIHRRSDTSNASTMAAPPVKESQPGPVRTPRNRDTQSEQVTTPAYKDIQSGQKTPPTYRDIQSGTVNTPAPNGLQIPYIQRPAEPVKPSTPKENDNIVTGSLRWMKHHPVETGAGALALTASLLLPRQAFIRTIAPAALKESAEVVGEDVALNVEKSAAPILESEATAAAENTARHQLTWEQVTKPLSQKTHPYQSMIEQSLRKSSEFTGSGSAATEPAGRWIFFQPPSSTPAENLAINAVPQRMNIASDFRSARIPTTAFLLSQKKLQERPEK